MKESFRKLTLLGWFRDRERITTILQDLGVVHLEIDQSFRNDSVDSLEKDKERLQKTIEAIRQQPESGIDDRKVQRNLSAEEVVKQVLELKERMESNRQLAEVLRKDHAKWLPWGEFDPQKIRGLAKYGFTVRLCVATTREFGNIDFGDLTWQVIHEGADHVYFIVVAAEDEVIDIPLETIDLPEGRLSETLESESRSEREFLELGREIRSFRTSLDALEKELQQIEGRLNFVRATGSYQEFGNGAVISLTGWFPASLEGRLVHFLDKEKLTYAIDDPAPGDNVPLLLRNRKYPGLFESITRIYELPGYYQLDLTPFIAVFYPILFAYCLGDAGYGLILLIAMTIGWFTFLRSMGNVALLGMILGAFTTLMGIVKSGTVFGISVYSGEPGGFLSFLSQYVIVPDDSSYMFNAFNVALLIGVVQILTGIILSIVNRLKYEGGLAALPQGGKLLIVISVIWIFLADMQGLEALQDGLLVRRMLLLCGILLVLLFHDMSQTLVSRMASGFLPLFFTFTGILGDVLSYIRLFALGVASSVLGLVVNQIGSGILENGWWGILVGVVFLLFGHTLNFLIALLGAFVHPLRLTFVEFYNNAEFKGGGIEYKPFRKTGVVRMATQQT